MVLRLLCKTASFLFVCEEDARFFLTNVMSMRASRIPKKENPENPMLQQ